MVERLTVFLTLLLLAFSPKVAAMQWEEIELENFKIYYAPQDERYARALQQRLELIRNKIISDIGQVDSPPIKVYIAPSHAEFLALEPQGSDIPPWAAAAAFARANLVLIRSPRLLKGEKKDIVKTATHEVAHVLLGRAVKYEHLLPRWLNEGFASYQAGEWDVGDITTMMWATVTDAFVPFHELAEGFPVREQDARVAYIQSLSMVAYLLDNYGRDAFISFIRQLKEEGNLNYSLKQTYGLTMKQLEARWLKKMRLTYSWIPIGTGASALWFVFTWLLVVGYIRKRTSARKKLRQWEIEEPEEG